jgi:RHS repeat-associated protein
VLRLVDLTGSGMVGLLYNLSDDGSERPRMWFLDFTRGGKPYLLERADNQLGATTLVRYAPSTRYFLEDQQRRATRWKTPLPFPVHVVAATESIDALSGGRVVSEFHYRHGYWDGVDREFRGFGMVEHRDTQDFAALPDEPLLYCAPVVARTWFHLGPAGDELGGWRETDYRDEYWAGDGMQLATLDDRGPFLSRFGRRDRRDALRALRGRSLRTEMYALDGGPRQDRPYQVGESAFGLREESPPADDLRRRIFFVVERGHRETQWERGDDPRTRLDFTWDHDAYGQPRATLNAAVPRGRDWRVAAAAGEPYLVTTTRTSFAQRDDAQRYLVDRAARTTRYQLTNDGSPSLWSLLAQVQADALPLDVIGQTRSFYDGAAFVGLPLGQLGDFGAPVRSEQLALTDAFLRLALQDNGAFTLPPYLSSGAADWSEYPDEFRALTPPGAGYVLYAAGPDPVDQAGYFVTTEQRRYDFQSGAGRGLTLARRDALSRETTIDYDAFAFLPVRATLPTGLQATAQYDYRVQQTNLYTEANGNQTQYTFTPLGLLASSLRMGKPGENAGDTLAQPGTRYTYDLFAFAQRRQPMSVRNSRRVQHALDSTAPPDERDQTLEMIEYSDGFGRLLQQRMQAESLLFGDGTFGGGLLPPAPGSAPGDLHGQPAPARVRVSSWNLYDNKGQVVRAFEPFFALGFDYQPPAATQLARPVTSYRDPRGVPLRVLRPDGSEERNVPGVPVDLADPTEYTPTPWESYFYDANDNAGRTHPQASAAWRSHWNTPGNRVQDALGRVIDSVVRNGINAEQHTRGRFDVRGNVLEVRDPLNRVSAGFVYDLLDRPWRIESLDGGTRRNVLDAAGNLLEHRDDRGALTLGAFDVGRRALRQWGRDRAGAPLTLRQRRVYGDAADSGLSRDAAASANLLGRLYRHYDEAGLLTVAGYDFKGNLAEKSRQVIGDPVMAAPVESSVGWAIDAYTVDWQPPAGVTLDQLAAQLLDATVYVTTSRYDAIDRARGVTLPAAVDGARRELQSHYDEAGQLDRIALDGTEYVSLVGYTAAGRRSLIAYGNGVVALFEHDPLTRRLLRLRSGRYRQADALTWQPSGDALQDFGYEYDLVGNLRTLHDRTPQSGVPGANPDALDRAFDYDPLYRLLSADGRECAVPPPPAPWQDDPQCSDATLTRAYRESYTYDAVGNLAQLTRASGGGTFSRQLAFDGNRAVTLTIGQQVSQYAYDAAGNLVAEDVARRMEWDHQSQMRVFRVQTDGAEPSVYTQYLYDAGGRRTKKLTRRQGGQWESTLYIDGLFEHVTSGGAENNLLHLLDKAARFALVRVGAPFPGDGAPPVQVHLGDHIGSSSVVVDGQGGFVNREEYRPWGETSMGSYARKRFRFTAKERDEESGFYYHGARYYAPWVGRWTAIDPLALAPAEASTHSPYRYAANNPLAFVDPTGLDDEKPPVEPPDPKQADSPKEFYRRLDMSRAYEHQQWEYLGRQRQSEHLVVNGSTVNPSGGITHTDAYQAEGDLKFKLDSRLRTLSGGLASASLRVGFAGDRDYRADWGPTVAVSTDGGGTGMVAAQFRVGPAKSDSPGWGYGGTVGWAGIGLDPPGQPPRGSWIFNNTIIYTARLDAKSQMIPNTILNSGGAGQAGDTKVKYPITFGNVTGYNRKLSDTWSIMTELGGWFTAGVNESSGKPAASWTTLEGLSANYQKDDPDSGYQWSFTVEATQETNGGGMTIWGMVGYGSARSQYQTIHPPVGHDVPPQ